jgi:hypothetical protein
VTEGEQRPSWLDKLSVDFSLRPLSEGFAKRALEIGKHD